MRLNLILHAMIFFSLAILLEANAVLANLDLPHCPLENVPIDEVALLQTHVQASKRIGEHLHQVESQRKEHDAACYDTVKRLEEELDGQLPYGNGQLHNTDALFPPTQLSIGPADGNCGDAAHGQNDPCNKYDHWLTFQEVARSRGEPFHVIADDTGGIELHDIGQGTLGDCYFLAALAAIANSHPDILYDMFEERQTWKSNVYTTRWLVNGQVSHISVDNMVPASSRNSYFAKPSDEGEWWTVILEKAWAKIFGSYAAIEGGQMAEALQAITQAPVASYKHEDTDEAGLWERIREGTKNKYPMTASTKAGGKAQDYGLAVGHAYTVLGSTTVFLESGDFKVSKHAVKMMNPWRTDYYKGAVPNTEKINGPDHEYGVFTMTMKEFYVAFYKTDMAMVREGYTAIHQRIELETPIPFKVVVKQQGDFYASIIWPDKRMLPGDCESLKPEITLKATSLNDPEKHFDPMPRDELLPRNSVSTEVSNPSAGGEFEILAMAHFKEKSFIDHVQLSIYAPSDTSVEVGQKQLGGPCRLGDGGEVVVGTKGVNYRAIPRQAAMACKAKCYAEINTNPDFTFAAKATLVCEENKGKMVMGCKCARAR